MTTTSAKESTIKFLVPLAEPRTQRLQLALVVTWSLLVIVFWYWWLQPAHAVVTWKFLLNTILLAIHILLPVYYFYFFLSARKPNPNINAPEGRVAMVVTKAPSEPWPLVRNTLVAMLEQELEHDTWLADEDPSEETVRWCVRHGVHISTRRGIAEYHRKQWPRRTRCKEGNLAYFYDHYGYENYDFVVQMDSDHVPTEGYLLEMLRPFADSGVGYVSAPSICDVGIENNWAARGRLVAEAPLHGALQAGYNNGFAPMCIGSHYAVRTSALKQIGGLGPELAEDHSTTLLMNSNGWRGVHAIEAEAHGMGPGSFADLVTQEYQWSKSLTVLLLTMTFKHMGNLGWKLRTQFLFAQCWYLLLCILMIASTLIPFSAIVSNKPWVSIVYSIFLVFSVALMGVILTAVSSMQRNGWLRPKYSGVITIESCLYQFARWPWVLRGIIAAIITVMTDREEDSFRITPKDENVEASLPVSLLLPYAFLVLVASVPVIFFSHSTAVYGYYFFAILNSIIYSGLMVVIVCSTLRQAEPERHDTVSV